MSTSALSRGTPYAITAWAPKTYQRPQRGSTFVRSARSLTAAGSTGTAQELGETSVGEEILTAFGVPRPGGILQERLAPQLLGDSQALDAARYHASL
jgi:hypothetical protein